MGSRMRQWKREPHIYFYRFTNKNIVKAAAFTEHRISESVSRRWMVRSFLPKVTKPRRELVLVENFR
jgi:hypothetical protein